MQDLSEEKIRRAAIIASNALISADVSIPEENDSKNYCFSESFTERINRLISKPNTY